METTTPATNSEPPAQPAPPPRVLVVGTGAIGGYYGGRLAQAGLEVAALCRSDFATVQSRGIHIESLQENFDFAPRPVLRQLTDYDGYPDYILVTLKVLPEIVTADIIRPVVGPGTVIVLIQNGVEIESSVADAFPNHEILSGLAFICVSRIAPGLLRHTCHGRLAIGRYPQGGSPAAESLAHWFRRAGTSCTVSPAIVTDRWRKLVWNAPFNPLSVLAGGLTTQDIMASPRLADLARRVMEEVLAIAEAAGHPLPPEVVERNLTETRAMYPYKTSMLLDYEAKRPMEVEAILGNAVRKAHSLGIAAPRLETLYALLTREHDETGGSVTQPG
ncbi:MAG: 2-dehydropantoate 2-reductase [Magnetococcales bacterium]|nr:2-dehydropantoate 2-reductase [Magnetococcales bacterium]